MAEWCVDNNLVLNTTTTNEILVDFRRSKRTTQTPLSINREEVERVDMGYYHLQSCKEGPEEAPLSTEAQVGWFIHTPAHRTTFESVFCQGCSVVYAGCTAESRRDLARVVTSAKKIIGAELPDLDSV